MLRGTIHSGAYPGCTLIQTQPNATTSSVVTIPIRFGAVNPVRPKPELSSLRALQASAQGYPGRIKPGQLLRFVITLANPTDVTVSLATTPAPSYAIGAYCARTPSVPGYQFARLYSLNDRPRPAVPAHGAVRFAMELAVPAIACPASRLQITWQSPSPAYGPQGPHTAFTIAVTG